MSLADFMKQLQEQDTGGIVYSTPPPKPVKVIPPDKPNVKVIAPTLEMEQPKTIKLKLNLAPPKPVETTQQVVQKPTPQPVQPVVAQPQVVTQPPVQQPSPPVEEKPVPMTDAEIAEQLFIKSGTEIGRKAKWMELYEKAKRSRQSNVYTDNMKIGKFTITPDDHVIILPDYDVVGKDPDDVIRDKWF